MGRPRELDEAKMVPVMLDRETRKIVETRKGTRGVSSFIRGLILEKEGDQSETEAYLQRRLNEAEAKINAFEKKEMAVKKEMKNIKQGLVSDFTMYVQSSTQEPSHHQRENWIRERCKGTGVKLAEAIVYLNEVSTR